jgi:signal transduction histidine kinase
MSEELVKLDDDKKIDVKFKPRARLLLQLGDQLIKNVHIALIELVKNSYDADANYVNIYMENPDNENNGVIIIEDNGFGMSAETVENVWLEPGSDFKSIQIKNKIYTPIYNRLPIGEKGIGRFGVHKLGKVIEMTTKTKDDNEVFVKIDWSDFDNYKYLEQVPIVIIERNQPKIFKNGTTGTNIVISNLRNKWERGIAREAKRSITSLSSPFRINDSFIPNFEILDKPGWFEGLLDWESVKNYSLFKFKIQLSGKEITAFKYDFIPWPTMTKIHEREVTEKDPLIDSFSILKTKDENKKDSIIDLSSCNIGTVTFEGYIFDFDNFVLKLGVSDKKGFKDYLRRNGGIKVYRDGLRVYDYGEPENDWLGLDYRRFQQPSKSISNNIIIGAIYLNRKESEDLIEKTNREGFVENEAYYTFKNSILHCIELVETLRLTDKKKLREFYGPTPKSEPVMSILGEAKQYIDEKVKDSEIKDQIVKYLSKIESDYKRVSENLLKAAGAGLSMSVVVHEVEKIIYEVDKVLKAEKASDRVLKLVKHLSSLIDGYAEIIRRTSRKNENIVDIIDQALFNTEYRLETHKIKVDYQYKFYRGLGKVIIAKGLLVSSIMNLIDNSIFWLDTKSFKKVELNEPFEKKIYVNIIDEGGYINVVIADNGTGFLLPTEDITEPFVTGKPGGMGLGLHIAQETMIAQSGLISFPEWGDFDIPNDYKEGALVVLSLKK